MIKTKNTVVILTTTIIGSEMNIYDSENVFVCIGEIRYIFILV